MSEFADALHEKIMLLQGRRDELEEEIGSIETRLEVLTDLLAEENGSLAASPIIPPKRRGRPSGSKNKTASPTPEPGVSHHSPSADLLREAESMEGTDPAVAERLKNRFRPVPRVRESMGPGIKAGGSKSPQGETQSDKTISVDDSTKDA